ncbi:MAG: hypothetical protein DDT29_01380 [Dehalococcoidia bacterium]|nr:hypothetical protein [Bacillota bacterium]
MSYEFIDGEIKEIVAAARIFSRSFDEEQFEALRELEQRLTDSGFLETVRGLVRLEQEMGVTANQVLDAFEKLLSDKERLAAEVADLQGKLTELQDKNQEAENRYRQQQTAIEQTRRELQAIQIRCHEEEKRLAVLGKEAERERGRIDKEVEQYRQKANVTKAEIVLAGQIKAEVENHGLSLELALDLSHAFAGYENAREQLAAALTKSQTLPDHINALTSERDKIQVEIAALKGVYLFTEDMLFYKKFYQRYQSASRLVEYLANWRGLYFLRCNNPLYALPGAFDKSKKCAHFIVEKPPISRCPCCDYPGTIFDSELYQLLNQPVGTSYELKLGEDK